MRIVMLESLLAISTAHAYTAGAKRPSDPYNVTRRLTQRRLVQRRTLVASRTLDGEGSQGDGSPAVLSIGRDDLVFVYSHVANPWRARHGITASIKNWHSNRPRIRRPCNLERTSVLRNRDRGRRGLSSIVGACDRHNEGDSAHQRQPSRIRSPHPRRPTITR